MEIRLENGFNIRDLGGYKNKDGLTIRYHRLIRGGYLSNLSTADQLKLYNYGVRTIIDLRTPYEIEKYPDKYNPSTEYIELPILKKNMGDSQVKRLVYKDEIPNPRAGYQHMFHLYYQLITNNEAQNAYYQFLTKVVQKAAHGGILFHCSTGKDRTGIASLILLHILGINSTTIKRDYLLTNQLSVERVNQRMNEARNVNSDPAYLKSIFDISTVRPVYFQFVEQLIKDLYGSFNLYLKEQLKIPDSLVNQLKHLFLTE